MTLSGSPSQPGTEELWRIFALESERIDVDGRTVSISDAAWSDDGPVVASWRTGDGHVSVSGIGIDRTVVLELVAASRELATGEWVELASLTQMC